MVQVYPQWQNYWFPPDTDAFDDDYGSPYMAENDIDAFYNSSTVFNDFYLSRTNAQSGRENQYANLSQWAYDGDSTDNADQNCTIEHLNQVLADKDQQENPTDTLEQDGFHIINDDEAAVLDFEDVNINSKFITPDPNNPDVTLGKSIIFNTLFNVIFGKYGLESFNEGDSDTGYGDNTNFGGAFDPQNPYKINKRVAKIFIEGYVRRYRILRERFPNANLGCYSLAAGWDVLSYDNNGEYEATRRGLSNFLLYINRAGPYGDVGNVNYILPEDEDDGPELGQELMSLMDSASVRLVLGSQISQIPEPLSNFGTSSGPFGVGTLSSNYEDWSVDEARLVLWDQISNTINYANLSVNLPEQTFKLSDYLKVAIHLPYRFGNAGRDDRNNVPVELIDTTFELIQKGNQNRESVINEIYYWAGAYSGNNIYAFEPLGGVFFERLDEVSEDGFDPTNPYAPSGRLFELELFNISGCEEPPLPFPPNQIQALENIITGEAFRSPVEGAVNSVLAGVGDVLGVLGNATDARLVRPDGTPISTFIDPDGNLQIQSAVGFLSERLNRATEISNEFQDHAYRLSGVSNYIDGFEAGGSIGDFPGLVGLQAIARNYNNVRNAIESGNLGEIVKDHYSPFFSSILGPGDALYESFKSLINGDLRNFLGTIPLRDDRLDLSQATIDQLENLVDIGNAILDFEQSIRNLIDSDNNLYFSALDYLAKSTLGFSVLTMAEDPCFSQKLLGQIAKPDLKGLLNIS